MGYIKETIETILTRGVGACPYYFHGKDTGNGKVLDLCWGEKRGCNFWDGEYMTRGIVEPELEEDCLIGEGVVTGFCRVKDIVSLGPIVIFDKALLRKK